VQEYAAVRTKSDRNLEIVKRVLDNPFAELGLERAIGLRWTLRDIQARRLKMSPVSDEDLRVLTELGLIEVREEGLVLTQAGTAAVNG
jgi:hypothetical protein